MVMQIRTTGSRARSARLLAAAAVVTGALVAAGCSSTSSQAHSAPPSTSAAPTPVVSTSATPTPTPATPTPTHTPTSAPSVGTSAPATLVLTEKASGSTVTVPAGDTVTLTLHNTYWAQPSSSAQAVLAPVGTPSTVPTTGTGCHPGSGCGTVTARFLARTPGTARLTSMRTSCGEALACTPAQAHFTVTLVITAAG